jgi:uncharacterized membrane protein
MVAMGSAGADSASTAQQGIFQWRPFLAPFHAVVLHFPIGFLTMAFILEVYRVFRPSPELRRLTVMVVWLSLITGAISASFGLMRAGGGGYETRMLDLHRTYGLAVPVATLFTLALQHMAYRNEIVRGWTLGYRGVLGATMVLLVVAGHFGGNLTHGSSYLVENAPQFVKELVEKGSAPDAATAAAELTEKEKFFTEKVQPIFEAKCYKCHGSKKQKGGYRLDKPELALQAGDSEEPAITPGDPLESYLVRLILLPPQHDDVMPPEGKQPLELEEMMNLIDWIRNGAVFPASSGELAQTNNSLSSPEQ